MKDIYSTPSFSVEYLTDGDQVLSIENYFFSDGSLTTFEELDSLFFNVPKDAADLQRLLDDPIEFS